MSHLAHFVIFMCACTPYILELVFEFLVLLQLKLLHLPILLLNSLFQLMFPLILVHMLSRGGWAR